jgi:hypothetical protein
LGRMSGVLLKSSLFFFVSSELLERDEQSSRRDKTKEEKNSTQEEVNRSHESLKGDYFEW